MALAETITGADRAPALRFPRATWPTLGRWVSPLVLLLLWELGVRSGLIPPRVLAAPSDVLATMWAMTISGELPSNVAVSLGRAAAGLAIGLTFGVILGLTAGLTKTGEAAIDPLMQIKRTIPSLALAPLFIVWFGIGETPKIVLIAIATVFPVYLNTFAGVRGVDKRLVEAARSLGLKGPSLIFHVILPGALPSFFVGLRYAIGISILVLVVAEQINAQAGIGQLINAARDFMRTDIIVVCLIVYALLGLAGDAFVRALERRALAWRPSFVEG
ncbi:Putative aliphatic sulfonates transport permease protein SsuC [Alphaproteobacteria bacterium SO-S41]|nr:Putative aliphatic sulfonates transport permease protein SsuC [Alphaproteobacteria bacterium SO-S41]